MAASTLDGLRLAPASAQPIDIPTVDPTQVYRLTITMTPTVEGVHLVAINVSLKHDDGTDVRTFSVPIIAAAGG